MALEQAKQKQLPPEERSQPMREDNSEQSSEPEGSEAYSDSEACQGMSRLEQPVEYEYSPLDGDSGADSELGRSSDESIALLAHEMLCCERDSETGSGSEDDDDDDDDGEEEEGQPSRGQEAQHTYARLMCSEEDEDLQLDQQQQQQQPPDRSLTASANESLLSQVNEVAELAIEPEIECNDQK